MTSPAASWALRLTLALGVVCLACSNNSPTPTAPTQPTGPVTDTFASAFTVNGSASRTFRASQAGTVTITLDSVGPPPTVLVGLGVGVPFVNSVPCQLTSSLTDAGPGAQISMHADPGSYCVKIFDVGNLVETVNFSMSITHP